MERLAPALLLSGVLAGCKGPELILFELIPERRPTPEQRERQRERKRERDRRQSEEWERRRERRRRERELREEFLARESQIHPERLATMRSKKKRGGTMLATGLILNIGGQAAWPRDETGEPSTGAMLTSAAGSGLIIAGIVLLDQYYRYVRKGGRNAELVIGPTAVGLAFRF